MDDMGDELIELEHLGWRALCEGAGGAFYGRTMTDTARMVLADGTTMSRDEVVASLASAPPWSSYEIEEPMIMPLSADATTVLYTGIGRRGTDEFVAVMASTYVRTSAGWRLALYQQTPAKRKGS